VKAQRLERELATQTLPKQRILLRHEPLLITGAQTRLNQWLTRAVWAVLLLTLSYFALHFTYALIDNLVVLSKLTVQRKEWQQIHAQKAAEKNQLEMALKQSQSRDGLEALVRNKLQWVSDQEILVRLH
jgi:cell division protein FtsB